MLWITELPSAPRAATSIAMPARMSGLSTTPPRSGGEPDERADLDVVGANGERRGPPLERGAAVHRERVGARAVDARAQARQKARQVLDVRLAGSVAEDRGAGGGDRGHEGVLGRRDAWLVEKDVGASELLGLELVGRADGDLRSQALQREEVRVHPPPAA